MDPDVHVGVQYRDAIFKKLKQIPENQFCFDCNLKNPSWCSIILGIFICYNCASPHRSMGTHLSFVRSNELDMWTLRQLAYLEQAGNKIAKTFFRTHGVTGPVDYTSQTAERWRNELAEKVSEIYPRKGEKAETEERKEESKVQVQVVPTVEEKPQEVEEKISQPVPKPIQVVSRPGYKAPTTEVKHRFKKTKAEDAPSIAFKPVSFKAQTEEEEFFDPQPLRAPAKLNPEPAPVPTPHVIQRKPVEKKAISSEDYEAQHIDPKVQKARINQFAGASSISSDMYFGRETKEDTDLTAIKLKEEASRIGNIAMEKAANIKESLSEAFTNLQSRFKSNK